VFLPDDLSKLPLTAHGSALQTNYVSQTGNHVGMKHLPVVTTTRSWFFITRVEVANSAADAAIVFFGDSITDGTASTAGANARWPDQVARRLNRTGRHVAVLNAAIAGNRILTDGTPNFGINALARFDRDVLSQSGATHLVVLEGINDFGMARTAPTPTAEDVIAGHRQIIARARARGLTVIGATLTPFQGAAYWTAEGEAKRNAFNEWMRTSGEYDAVIDFDAAVRDPKEPTKFRSDYHSGDNLHPSDLGYRVMGDAVDLALFRAR
jgi:lysophospholipase L1-like esterase